MKHSTTAAGIAALLAITVLTSAPALAGRVEAWGADAPMVPSGEDFVAVAGGYDYLLSLRKDGVIVPTGTNALQHNYLGSDYVDIAAGPLHSLALKADGSVVGKGSNGEGQLGVPAGYTFVDIAVGTYVSLGLTDQGYVIAWGDDYEGLNSDKMDQVYIDMDGGDDHNVALTADGRIVQWGDPAVAQPDGEAGYRDIAAAYDFTVAIAADGAIKVWGNAAMDTGKPAGNDFIAVSAGGSIRTRTRSAVALRANGTVAAWGSAAGAPGGSGFTAVSAGADFAAGVQETGTIDVLAPEGGETYDAASTIPVVWTVDGSISTFVVEYSADLGATWNPVDPPAGIDTLIIDPNEETGITTYTYEWTAPLVESDEVLVRVSSSPIPFALDQSETPFTITLANFNPADFDGDGDADADDLGLFYRAWLSTDQDAEWNPVFDIAVPADGIVDFSDFAVFARFWQVGVEPIQ